MTRITQRLLKSLNRKQAKKEISLQENGNLQNQHFTMDLKQNEQIMNELFRNCSDVVYRYVQLHGQIQVLLIYIDGMVDTVSLEETVLKPLINKELPQKPGLLESFGEFIRNQAVTTRQIKRTSSVSETVQDILSGHVAVFTTGENQVLLAYLTGYEQRAVSEPETESVVRGPREGFTESLRTNTSLLRRKIRSPRLKAESITIGALSQTDVALVYIEGIVDDSILDEVRNRVSRIEIDAVLDSGFIEEFIEDAPFSPFPTVQNTERPDVVLSSLLEGKIGMIVNGSPFVLIVPMTFWSVLQAAEDYYEHFIYTTAIRWLRFMLLLISLLLPSLYVAATTFHPQFVPAELLLSIAAAREGVPFPAVVEAFMMELMFEALREAGIRLPKPIGSSVSMVGALVIGESAVNAGIVAAPLVIVVAFTGIASFSIPRYSMGLAFRIIRFPLLILAGTLGFYGIGFGLTVLLIHLVNLRSFGVPYLAPVSPRMSGNLGDVFIRAPRWSMHKRPKFVVGGDKKRIPEDQKPGPQRS